MSSTTPAPLGLPAPGDDQKTHILNVATGESTRLDSLGPMIVNSDGTLSRIANWENLTEPERERVMRLVVKKRNAARLNDLREAEEKEKKEEDQASA